MKRELLAIGILIITLITTVASASSYEGNAYATTLKQSPSVQYAAENDISDKDMNCCKKKEPDIK